MAELTRLKTVRHGHLGVSMFVEVEVGTRTVQSWISPVI